MSRRRAAAGALTAVVLLAGCSAGSGDPGTSLGDSTPTSAASAPAPSPTESQARTSSASSAPATAPAPTSATASSPPPTVAVPTAPPVPVDFPVPRALFGTHVKNLGVGGQPTPPRAGAVRLWDSAVAWRQLEPARGRIDWRPMDRAVAAAEAMGAADILWVHGSIPRWAAEDPDSPGIYGPGTTSTPDTKAYLGFLRKVATRYRGRITSYQVWNEANISIFYRGTPAGMAELTERAHVVLERADPDALLVGASTTVRAKGPVRRWYDGYVRGLAERGWPVDALAVHLYPKAEQGVGTRAAYIRTMRAWLAQRGWTGPVWDTEVNFGDRRDFATTTVVVPQRTAAAWVARTYLDSLALGVQRVYWYAWNDHILGIDQVDARTGAILPAGRAYLTVQKWLDRATWHGCTGELMVPTGQSGALTTCRTTLRGGAPGLIVFTNRGTTTMANPGGRICRLDGQCATLKGARLTVGPSPVLIRVSS